MQLNRVQVEQSRDVRDDAERSVAENPDGQNARLPSSSGQRRCLLGRDVAGAAWHEHEACECRWPGGAQIGAAVETADLGAAENELSRRLRRFARTHQRGTDEESVHAAGKPIDVPATDNARLRNEQAVGSKAGESLRGGEVDREIAQVAVIDADQRRSERQRAPHLAFVMNLDQHIHAEAPRFLDHGARCVVVQQGQHDENGVGTCDPGLDDLPSIDEEVLGKDRSFEPLPGGCEIVERAAEVSGVGEHAQRIGNAGVAARNCRRIGGGVDCPRGRRSLLDLKDEPCAQLCQRVDETARRGRCACPQGVERNAVEAVAKLVALAGGDPAENSDRLSHGSPR